jgi:hypothetical protein
MGQLSSRERRCKEGGWIEPGTDMKEEKRKMERISSNPMRFETALEQM